MKLIRLSIATALVFATFAVQADLIVEAEIITDIRVGPWGTESFAIRTTDDDEESDDDHCVGEWVIFKRSNYPSDGSYDRAYALALSAMSAKKAIIVDTIDGVDCADAQTIGVGL